MLQKSVAVATKAVTTLLGVGMPVMSDSMASRQADASAAEVWRASTARLALWTGTIMLAEATPARATRAVWERIVRLRAWWFGCVVVCGWWEEESRDGDRWTRTMGNQRRTSQCSHWTYYNSTIQSPFPCTASAQGGPPGNARAGFRLCHCPAAPNLPIPGHDPVNNPGSRQATARPITKPLCMLVNACPDPVRCLLLIGQAAPASAGSGVFGSQPGSQLEMRVSVAAGEVVQRWARAQ